MKFIENIMLFFKRMFNKEEIKMLDAPDETFQNNNKKNFINSLKINIENKQNKKKVETLTCFGDGLGIQKKLSY